MFDYSDYLFYWQDRNNYKVDYILYNGIDIEVPIEVKYTTSEIKKTTLTELSTSRKRLA
jgi:predicted AAA+ superfamily ATPase